MATGVGPPNANRCRDERDEDLQQEQPPVRPPRVIRQPHRGGYDCEFIERPSKAFQCECPVCLLVLREPHQVTCCGYSFCATCVKRVQEDKKPCPTCNEANFNVFFNKGLKRSLYEFRVYCCQRGEGCDWVGELGELDRHLNLQPLPEKLLVGCQFSEVDCTYCVQPFQRRYVHAHQSDDCPKRPYACQHCDKYAATFKATYEEVTQNHWPVCPFFPLSCPNNCDLELVLQRQEVEHHVSQDCPLTLVLCDFHMVGCKAHLTRRDMPSHISENLTGHTSLLQAHMMTHPGENMATYLWLMVGSIQKVVLDNATIRSELHEAQETLQDTRDELQQSRDDLQQTRDELRGTHETVAELKASGISQQEQNESLQKAIDVCQEENRTLQQQNDDLTEQLTASEQKMQAALDTQVVRQKHELAEIHAQIAVLTQTSTQLQATVTAHKKETTAAQHTLDQHKRESNEKQKAAKDELSKKLTVSERAMQTALNTQQAALTQQKNELTEKLSASEQKLQATIATQQTTITKCRDESRRLQQSLTEQERKQLESKAKLKTIKDDLTRKITASEQKIKTQEATLNQHQKTLEKVTCTGTLPFDFTITEFEKHKRASDVWYSPPFYTHTHGYRMCIKVWTNGGGSGRGTHLTVSGFLMRGVFDDDLQWPFQGAITIQLLNQLEDSKHHTYTIDFAETTDPQCISRVTSGERAGSGWGTHTFLPHTQLGLNTYRNCQFLKDDQLKFRVSKATNIINVQAQS